MSNVIINPHRLVRREIFTKIYTDDHRQDGYTFEDTQGFSYAGVAVIVGLHDEGHHPYWHFTNVAIPAGATIIDARFDNVIYASYGSADRTVEWDWRGVKQADPGYPTDYADYHDRPLTTASVAASRASPYAAGTVEPTENLAPILQELVDQAGWVSGNSILIYATPTGGTHEWAWRASASEPRTLTVEYAT